MLSGSITASKAVQGLNEGYWPLSHHRTMLRDSVPALLDKAGSVRCMAAGLLGCCPRDQHAPPPAARQVLQRPLCSVARMP